MAAHLAERTSVLTAPRQADSAAGFQSAGQLPGGRRTMLADSPSNFGSRWESVRGLCDAIENELKDRRRVMEVSAGLDVVLSRAKDLKMS